MQKRSFGKPTTAPIHGTPRQPTSSDQESPSLRLSKSVSDNKPFRAVQSGWNRFAVICSESGCLFQMHFDQHVDGVFHLYLATPHTCSAAFPTILKIWVDSKTREFLLDSPALTVSELTELSRSKHGVNVSSIMIFRSLREIKNNSPFRGLSFGHLSSFLSAHEMNERTTTRVESDGGVFQRAFVVLGMCLRKFPFTTRVISLDACLLKANCGGVVLVITVLDGNGQVFLAILGIAESENAQTWTWFLQLVQTAFNLVNRRASFS